MNDMKRLAAIIDLLVTYHPSGIMILLGERPSLSDVEWFELTQYLHEKGTTNTRVDTSLNPDGFFSNISKGNLITSFLESIGGWENVVSAACSFRKVFPTDWDMFIDHVRYIENPFSSRLYRGSMLARIATKYSVDPKTITRRRKTVPMAIAREAVGCFQLAISG